MSPRQRFIALLVIVASLCAFSAQAATRRRVVSISDPASEGGYANLTSVVQGGAIRFHIASIVSPFTLNISNIADARFATSITNLQSRAQKCSDVSAGCGWDLTTTFDVPANWPSGYYQASFPTGFGTRRIIFVVRPAQPGSTSEILVVSPTNTYQAFNTFGGASLNATGTGARSDRLSFDRPYQQDGGLGRFDSWEREFVKWMISTNRRFEVVTDHDLHDPTILPNYNVVVLVGHSAYWTDAARGNLETYSNNGGHIAIFGGNTMYFRVSLENNGRTLVGERNARVDVAGEPSSIITSNWYRQPVNRPENRIVATSFRSGGLANKANNGEYEMVPVEQRSPWTVMDPGNFVFTGTNLSRGGTFGRDTTGLEVDGVVFNCDISGFATRPDGSDEAPLNFHILAITRATLGWGTLGYYVNQGGGAVFNAASQGWVWGLEFDDVVQRITANVLDRFSSGARFQYDPVQTPIVAEDLFNCPQTLLAQPGWRTDGPRGTVNASCAFEGPGGLELAGSSQIGIARSIARAGEARDRVELRFYVKADDLQRRTDTPRPLVTLQNRAADGTVRQVAHVELDVNGDTRRIRLARRDNSGGFAATDFITLANGWHLVEASWRSPGTLSIQVDGGTALTLENPTAGQTANEMVIEFPPAQLTDAGRLCIDAIAAGTEKPGRVAQLQ